MANVSCEGQSGNGFANGKGHFRFASQNPTTPPALCRSVSMFVNYSMLQPIYTPDNTTPSYPLNWGITIFWREIPISETDGLEPLKDATAIDSVRILKHRITNPNGSQFFVSTIPFVSPSQILRGLKGRLQYLIRGRRPKAFHRN